MSARKRKRSPPLVWRLTRGAVLTLLLLALLLSGALNWFVHQPRRWQQQQIVPLPKSLTRPLLQFGNAYADITDALAITGHDVLLPLDTPLDTNAVACAGLPRFTDPARRQDLKILEREGFVVGYSPTLRHPLWVAYRAEPYVAAGLPPRPRNFTRDPEAPNAPHHKDYTRSGYDRGHMAPNLAIAARHGVLAQRQTFLTSNICPQRPNLNQGPWSELEYRISEVWPQRYGTLWVIVGAVIPPDKPQRLPSGVSIPTAFYKVVVAQNRAGLRAFAVYMPQNIPRRAFSRSTLVSIDALQQITGLDFLADLPDELEHKLEAQTPTRLWPTGAPGLIRVLQERYRTYN